MHSQWCLLLQLLDAHAAVLTAECNLLFKFTEHVLRDWLAHVGVKTLFINSAVRERTDMWKASMRSFYGKWSGKSVTLILK